MTAIKLRLYACGGLGQNLGKLAPKDYTTCYIDSSDSNLTSDIDRDTVFQIEGLDGSGKNRALNYAVIAKAIHPIIEQHEPGDFTVILFSSGGGSGSVIGPLLAKALLDQKRPFIVVRLGSDESKITLTNTINTTKSLESIIALTKLPIVESYHEHFQGVTRDIIDGDVVFALESIATLASQDNHELDGQDLINLVQFHRVTPLLPQLASVSIQTSRADAAKVAEPIAVASLHNNDKKYQSFGTPFYTTVGRPRNEEALGDTGELHFVINTVDVERQHKSALERMNELEQAHSNYRQRRVTVDVDDEQTTEGLVL